MSLLHAHLVFVTKYRRKVFTAAMLTYCETIMREVCTDLGADLVEFNGEADHMHLLVSYPPSLAISTLVQRLQQEYDATPNDIERDVIEFIGMLREFVED